MRDDAYAKAILPVSPEGDPCIIHMNVSILAFPEIDTLNLKFTSDFYIKMRWYDLRLNYMDLNNNTFLNGLNEEDLQRIWAPKLAFLNALGPYTTVIDGDAVGALVREENPLQENIEATIEGNTITLQSLILIQPLICQNVILSSHVVLWNWKFNICFQRILS